MTDELPPQADQGWPVMSKMCGSCIFTTRTPLVRDGRREELQRLWAEQDGFQVCHQAATWDEDDEQPPWDEQVVCHGFFREVYLEDGTGQPLRVSEALTGGFNYVNPEDYPLKR